MANIVFKTVYFDKPGPKNTEYTLKLAKQRAEELSIKNIWLLRQKVRQVLRLQVFRGYNIIVVTHAAGFREPDFQEFLPRNRRLIERNEAKILKATHFFRTLGRAILKKFGAIQIDGIVAKVLHIFGQGMKVSCEITCMAADAGLIRTDEEDIAIWVLEVEQTPQ